MSNSLIITSPKGNKITTMEQWAGCVRTAHWKPGRSAYSLADFVMNRGGAEILTERVSSVLSQPVILEEATPEYRARFDSYRGPSNLDLGIFGYAGRESSLFVGLEAKVNESFDKDVRLKYRDAVRELSRKPSSRRVARVRGLLSDYFGETAVPCDSRFADVGYQLLTGVAGTAAAEQDVLIFYVMVFRTDLYDEEKGRENRLDYERFIEAAGGRVIVQGEDGFDAHEIVVAGKRLACVYDHFEISD